MDTEELYKKYPSLRKFEEMGDDVVEFNDGREEALLHHILTHPSYPLMRNNPALILSTMDTFAAQQDFLINIGSDKGRIVADLIAEHKPKVSVEMGGYVGYSAIWFADAMRRAASPGTEVKLWSLEYEGRFARIARELVELAGLGDVVEVVVGEAGGSAVKLREEGKIREGEVDFLFLDHVEELYLPDFKIGWLDAKVLRKGALVVADNVVRPGAPEYRAFVRSQDGLSSEGVRGLIIPGDMEDELEVTTIL